MCSGQPLLSITLPISQTDRANGQGSLGQDWWLHVAAPIYAICGQKELLSLCGLAPVLLHGLVRERHRKDLETWFIRQLCSNGNRLTGICLSA